MTAFPKDAGLFQFAVVDDLGLHIIQVQNECFVDEFVGSARADDLALLQGIDLIAEETRK